MPGPFLHSRQEPYIGTYQGVRGFVRRLAGSALVRTSIKVTAVSILGQAPSFFIPIAIAATFGANASTDAFFLSLTLASFVVNALSPAAQQAAIPFFVAHRQKGGDPGQFLGKITGAMMLLASGFVLLVLLIAHFFLVQVTSFAATQRLLVERLLWGFVPFTCLSVIASIWTSALNAERAYFTPALSPGVRSLIILGVVLFMGPSFGVYTLVVAHLLGELSRLWFLSHSLFRYYKNCFSIRFLQPTAEVKEFFKTGAAQIVGSATLGTAPLVDRLMASWLEPGSVSVLDYAERIWQIPVGLVMSGFLVVALSQWSQDLYGQRSIHQLSHTTQHSAVLLFGLCLPVCVLAVIFRHAFVGILFAHGRFPQGELPRLANVMAALVVGAPVYVAGLTYTRTFLVLKRSDWLLRISVLLILIKILFNLVFMHWWGLIGIAFSTTVMYALSLLLCMVIYHRRLAIYEGRVGS